MSKTKTSLIYIVGSRSIISPLDGAGLALEPIGHHNLVLLMVIGAGQDIGALYGLREVAEDIVNDEDALGCVLRASDVWKENRC